MPALSSTNPSSVTSPAKINSLSGDCVKTSFLPVSFSQLTCFNDIFCYFGSSLMCFWRECWQWYICIVYHIFLYRIQLADNLWVLRSHLCCQTCIPIWDLIVEKRGKMHCGLLGYANITLASFTFTGNMPKEVKEAHWRSRINLWTMCLESQRTHSRLWSEVMVWLYGPRNTSYSTKMDTNWRALECHICLHC